MENLYDVVEAYRRGHRRFLLSDGDVATATCLSPGGREAVWLRRDDGPSMFYEATGRSNIDTEPPEPARHHPVVLAPVGAWLELDGSGEPPRSPNPAKVERRIRFRDCGSVRVGSDPDENGLYWEHRGKPGDIVAVRYDAVGEAPAETTVAVGDVTVVELPNGSLNVYQDGELRLEACRDGARTLVHDLYRNLFGEKSVSLTADEGRAVLDALDRVGGPPDESRRGYVDAARRRLHDAGYAPSTKPPGDLRGSLEFEAAVRPLREAPFPGDRVRDNQGRRQRVEQVCRRRDGVVDVHVVAPTGIFRYDAETRRFATADGRRYLVGG